MTFSTQQEINDYIELGLVELESDTDFMHFWLENNPDLFHRYRRRFFGDSPVRRPESERMLKAFAKEAPMGFVAIARLMGDLTSREVESTRRFARSQSMRDYRGGDFLGDMEDHHRGVLV